MQDEVEYLWKLLIGRNEKKGHAASPFPEETFESIRITNIFGYTTILNSS